MTDADPEECTETITVDALLPCFIGATEMWTAGGSPFMLQFQLMGRMTALQTQTSAAAFRRQTSAHLPLLRRVSAYYLDSDWPHFDDALARIGIEGTPSREWQRHDMFHQLLEKLTVPIWANLTYPDLKARWNSYTGKYLEANPSKSKEILSTFADDHGYQDYQQDLIDALLQFCSLGPAMLPGFYMENYPIEVAADPRLRLLRDDFEELSAFYLRAFEACHNVVPLIVEWINLCERGTPLAFQHPSEVPKNRQPNNRKQFRRLTSHHKAAYLKEVPWLHDFWKSHLDRKLRNSLGHSACRHDLRTGTLHRREKEHVRYVDFVHKVYGMHRALLFALLVQKLGRVYQAMLRGNGD